MMPFDHVPHRMCEGGALLTNITCIITQVTLG